VGSPELAIEHDGSTRSNCPACGASGWLFGDEVAIHRQPIEFDETDPESTWQIEAVIYETQIFVCGACSLPLEGRLELDAAHMPDEYMQEREVEPDYEPDYGNE
jgi:hypothetical protein